MRTRGKVSEIGGHQAHLNALAYMTDSFFIGTAGRAHKTHRKSPSTVTVRDKGERKDFESQVRTQSGGQDVNVEKRPEIGMMVSLDHTIYFHRPRDFRADEWIFSQSESPWTGDGRGFVTQKIWTKEGRLIATCFQEVNIQTTAISTRYADSALQGLGTTQTRSGEQAVKRGLISGTVTL